MVDTMIKFACRPLLLAALLTGCQQSEGPGSPDTRTDERSATAAPETAVSESDRESAFGVYRGYREAAYDGVIRESRYVEVGDGTRIALDILHPTKQGARSEQPLPVAFKVTRYWRSYLKEDGTIHTATGDFPPGQNTLNLKDPKEPLAANENRNTHQELLRHGYIIVFMDSRGTGSSFGVMTDGFMREVQDMKEIIDWIAAQRWSTGKVGMFGASWPGIVQMFAAMGNPEPLKALFSSVPNYVDFYRIGRGRGAYLKGAMLTMRKTLVNLSDVEDEGQAEPAERASYFGENIVGPPPVDDDPDGTLLSQARAGQGSATFDSYIDDLLQHPAVAHAIEELSLDTPDKVIDTLFYAASLNEALRGKPELRRSLADAQWPQKPESVEMITTLLARVNEAAIPTYLWDGWQDPMPNERILWYHNLDMPRRLTVGPWSHNSDERDDPRARAAADLITVETLRWFDFWLKGIDNGIMDEAPITYAVMQDKDQWEWREADDFPPPDARPLRLYFSDGPSGSVASANDGLLKAERPVGEGHKDQRAVDYSAQSGEHTRYHDAAGGGPIAYTDFAPNDAKGLTYTTAPLESDLLTAGFPVITLYTQATVPDAIFTVYLEEVRPDGYSTMITQGSIRASHRTPWTPPYDTNGVPWTSSLEQDILATTPLTEEIAEIRYALEPVANRWDKGNRIRVSILNADETAIWVIPQDPPPEISIWRDAAHPSHVELNALSDRENLGSE